MNPLNKGSDDNSSITIAELESLQPWDECLKEIPDFKYYVTYDFYKIDNIHYHSPGLYGFHNGKFYMLANRRSVHV